VESKAACAGAPMWPGTIPHVFSREHTQMAGSSLSTAPSHWSARMEN
jgi:hypothetical protein